MSDARVVIYKKDNGRVPIAKVPDPEPVGDAVADTSGVKQLLGQAQRQAAKRREQQLEDTLVSLYRSLDTAELAFSYDQTYGRPTDEDARRD